MDYRPDTPDLMDNENDAWLYVGHNTDGDPTYRMAGGTRTRTNPVRAHEVRVAAVPARTRQGITEHYGREFTFTEFFAADREQRPTEQARPLVPEAADWREDTPDLLQNDGDGWLYIGHSPDGVARYSMVSRYRSRGYTAEECTTHRREQHEGGTDLSGRRSRDDLRRDFYGAQFTEMRAPDRPALEPKPTDMTPVAETSELEAYKAQVRAEARRVAAEQGWCRTGLARTFANLDLGPVDEGHEVTMTVTMRVQRDRRMTPSTARDRARNAMRAVQGVTGVTVTDSRELS